MLSFNKRQMIRRKIELLAPAKDAEIAIEAIRHGADAVYIGASSHGARVSAANTLDDLKKVVEFAHQFHAKVYSTVNTIIHDKELSHVERLITDLYKIGIDALIVQDMSVLRMDLPPIQLHASTQCDTRTIEKARFLESVGFSQIVLARELTLGEIKGIADAVNVPIETFVHGALCVSYSGRCHLSQSLFGRSANRGECAQPCRLPYTLSDANGKIIVRDKHLLSLKDFNASDRIADLLQAGVSSFKIEGRLKDIAYVKNITAYYRRLIDAQIEVAPHLYERASFGTSDIEFTPNPAKSFNRGFTHYFLDNRRPADIASLHTPKSLGEKILDLSLLNNGDGISYFNDNGEYDGCRVNKIENGRIFTTKGVLKLPKHTDIYRTSDNLWEQQMAKKTAVRRINVDISIDEKGVSASDERGNKIRIALDVDKDIAQKPIQPEKIFAKLGETIYHLHNFENILSSQTFIPASQLTALRRQLIRQLDTLNNLRYQYPQRGVEDKSVAYPLRNLSYKENVSNRLADEFYRSHNVSQIEPALESQVSKKGEKRVVMTCRHCILRELNMCKRQSQFKYKEPLQLSSSDNLLTLEFDCKNCEMKVLK